MLIIGILSAVALPQYQKAVEKSRASEAFHILRYMRQQGELCELERGAENCGGLSNEELGIELPTGMECSYNGETENCCGKYWCYSNNGEMWGPGGTNPTIPSAIRFRNTDSVLDEDVNNDNMMYGLEYHDDGKLYCWGSETYCKMFKGEGNPI